MKRHPALVILSSDHHQALVQARRLAQAAGPSGAATLGASASAFLTFWEEHTAPHFREEEEILLPAYALHGDPAAEPVVHVLVDHVRLRSLAHNLGLQLESGGAQASTALELASGLTAHVRYEENVLFPLIEAAVPPDALGRLGQELREARPPE